MLFEADALVVVMLLVPNLLSRNRCFSLFENPELSRARCRAAALRGIVRQLTGAHGKVESLRVMRGEECELSYAVPTMKLFRRASLTALELACVRYLAERTGSSEVQVTPEDRMAIDAALGRFAVSLRLAKV